MSWSDNGTQTESRAVFRGGPSTDTSAIPVQSGLMSVEQQRAVAEVQARMMIARMNPRDYRRCIEDIRRACSRPAMASAAFYEYPRGGQKVSGASIRLAECVAQKWGNIASGIKVLSRTDGWSECVAYAWDLETGYYDERQFQVRHWRDTREGGYALTDERDIYELEANMGQRRKRAVLLTVIPGDVLEEAIEQCELTLKADADTSPEALKKMLEAFDSFGVSREMIETRYQCHLEAIRPVQVIELRKIYNSMKDGMSSPKDWFRDDPIASAAQAVRRQEGQKAAGKQNVRTPHPGTQRRQEAAQKPAEVEEQQQQPSGTEAQQEQPESAAEAEQSFEALLSDHTGEPLTEVLRDTGEVVPVSIKDPVEYGRWLAEALPLSPNSEALWENNIDHTIAASHISQEADEIISAARKQMMERAEERQRMVEQQRAQDAAKKAEPKATQADKDMKWAVENFIPEFDQCQGVSKYNELIENVVFKRFVDRMQRESVDKVYPLLVVAMTTAKERAEANAKGGDAPA